MTENFDLAEYTKGRIRALVDDLDDPDEEIPSDMCWLGPYGFGVMPVFFGGDEDSKDRCVDGMTAAVIIGRAKEVSFTSRVWTVGPRDSPHIDRPVTEHPDRTEAIVVMHIRPNTSDAVYSAPLTRYKNKRPDLGPWEGMSSGGGRFADAIHLGFHRIKDMPDEVIEIIDEGWQTGKQDELVEQFAHAEAVLRARAQ